MLPAGIIIILCWLRTHYMLRTYVRTAQTTQLSPTFQPPLAQQTTNSWNEMWTILLAKKEAFLHSNNKFDLLHTRGEECCCQHFVMINKIRGHWDPKEIIVTCRLGGDAGKGGVDGRPMFWEGGVHTAMVIMPPVGGTSTWPRRWWDGIHRVTTFALRKLRSQG